MADSIPATLATESAKPFILIFGFLPFKFSYIVPPTKFILVAILVSQKAPHVVFVPLMGVLAKFIALKLLGFRASSC